MQAVLTASILLFSSLAGCLSTEESDEPLVIVSTYHISEIVSAIVGSEIDVEILAPSNIPVHDFDPTAADIARLQSADLFLYHGIGLESWADSTLESLGDKAPKSVQTHAMPDGSSAYDYETLLIMDLCMHLSEGPYEEVALVDEEEHASDVNLHAEHLAYTLEMTGHDEEDDDHDHAEEDDDHDDHAHEEDGEDHDDHADDDHDEHDHGDDHDEHDHGDDDHEEHNHISPLETPTPTTNCPAETGVQIFHLDEGEYVLEFEIEEDAHEFNLVVLQMNGAHDHDHDHGDDDHGDDDHSDDDHGDDDHGDDDHGHDEEHGEDHDDMTPEHALEMFDTNNDSAISWDEFWASWEDEHDHEEMVCYNMNTHTVDTSYDTETACEAAGLMWTSANSGEEEHGAFDEAVEEYMMSKLMDAFNASANDDSLLQLSELSNFIASVDAIEDDMESDYIEIMMTAFDDDNDGQLSLDEFMEMMESMEEEEHDNHGGEDNGEVNETEMMEIMFNMFDLNEDNYINASELTMLSDMDEHEEGMGYATLHIEETGDYGIAVNHADAVKIHVLMGEGNHDDHAGHEDHDDHEEHDEHGEDGEEHDDHDDHEGEEIAFDPHSWLDPLAYKAQVNLILNELKATFPDLADTFQSNADEYIASLDNLHIKFEDAFGENGTCTNKAVAANHNAYSYLGQRYGLDFITIHGIDPEGEPTASDITEVVEKIEEDGLTVLFLEEYTADGAVSSIVEQTVSSDMPNGIQTLTLYTMELPPKDSNDDYISLMQKNLDNLKIGLGC